MALLVGEAKTGLRFPLLASLKLGSADFSENLFLSVFKAVACYSRGRKAADPNQLKSLL